MHLHLRMPGTEYSTDLYGLDRAAAHRLITALGEHPRSVPVLVRLEDETVAEQQSGRRGQYSGRYEVER
jgi:dihydroorotase-like cyclic amidohydrolase